MNHLAASDNTSKAPHRQSSSKLVQSCSLMALCRKLFLCKALKLVNDTRDGPLVYVSDSRRMRRTHA